MPATMLTLPEVEEAPRKYTVSVTENLVLHEYQASKSGQTWTTTLSSYQLAPSRPGGQLGGERHCQPRRFTEASYVCQI